MKRIVATNLTDLHAEPSFLSELLTQVVYGTELEIVGQKDDEWCHVRQADGYLGWTYAPYLTDAAAPAPAPTHMIGAPVVEIFARAGATEDPPISRLLAGTSVRVVEISGEHARVEFAGAMLPAGWIASAQLRPLRSFPLAPPAAREQMIADARRLTGVYYLWGGTTALGIDCSGLAQLVHRLSGYTIPRDARLQFPVGQPAEPPFQPGDLLFFHSEKDPNRITHVGLSTGGWRMIHSSRARNGVYEEDLAQLSTLRTRFAGARRFV